MVVAEKKDPSLEFKKRRVAVDSRPVLKRPTVEKGPAEPGAVAPKGVTPTWRQVIERESVTKDITEVASYLQENLGQRVTAYLSGVTDVKLVGQWASGKVKPRSLPVHRLRSAYQTTRYLVEAYGADTAQAWLFGTNSHLDSKAPAYVLRHGESPDDWDDVVSAAKSFVEDVP